MILKIALTKNNGQIIPHARACQMSSSVSASFIKVTMPIAAYITNRIIGIISYCFIKNKKISQPQPSLPVAAK